jgi:hypothetical protein
MTIIENLEPNIDFRVKDKLIKTFKEVDDLRIDAVQDNHKVKVYLKTDTTFSYGSKRFSFNEKIKLNYGRLVKTKNNPTKYFSVLFAGGSSK